MENDEALRALEKKLQDEASNARATFKNGGGEYYDGRSDAFNLAASELAALLTTRQEVAPVEHYPDAWLIPVIVSFKGALRTNCPADLQDEIEGTVAWDAKVGKWCDSSVVVDKYGVEHRPQPLFAHRFPTGQTSDARDAGMANWIRDAVDALNAVTTSDFGGPRLRDINGRNWWDVQNELLQAVPDAAMQEAGKS